MEGKRAVSEVQAMALRAVKGRGARKWGGGVQLSLFEIRFDISTTEPKKLFTLENNISMLSKTMLLYSFVV